MKNLTKEQLKAIELLKTDKLKNLRLAFDLNMSQKLELESVYTNLYKKWESLVELWDDEGLTKHFPILSLASPNHPFKGNFDLECSDFGSGIESVCDFISDILFFIDDSPSISIKAPTEIRNNDYKELAKLQEEIITKTGLTKDGFSLSGSYDFEHPF